MPTHTRRRLGAASIEFALGAPVMILFFAGTAESAWYFTQQVQLTAAANAGARAAVVLPEGEDHAAAAEAEIYDVADAYGLDADAVQITTEVVGWDQPEAEITLDLVLPYDSMTGLVPMPDTVQVTVRRRMEDQY